MKIKNNGGVTVEHIIKFQIETLSNLFIGGSPVPFEIGGIDQQTALDVEGFPFIPASSFKGALRAIVREDNSDQSKNISQLYASYLKNQQNSNQQIISNLVKEKNALERIKNRYETADKMLSAEYLFGINGFNSTPKLIFNDLILCNKFRDKNICFSIDIKNSIDITKEKPVSNPRTYKSARKGLIFTGEIQLYKIELLGETADKLCKKYIIENLKKFNNGIYRLGNSKSRGYGKVRISVEDDNEVLKI